LEDIPDEGSIKPKTGNLPEWTNDSLALVDSLPRSFSATRVELGSRWDNVPLATTVEGKVTKVAFPSQKPVSDNAKLAAGFILKFIQLNDFQIEKCTAEASVQDNFWAACANLNKEMQGAYLCLSRNNLTYVDNIPKEYQLGWDFAYWYAYSNATKVSDTSSLVKPRRVVNMILQEKPWGSVTAMSVLNRVSTLIREAAKKQISKLTDLRKTLKSEETFLQTFCGKKPVPGLYTEQEFEIVKKFYDKKVNRIKELYSNIPNDYAKLGPSGLNSYFKECSIKNIQEVQVIEESKSKRIPDLLVTTRKGKSQVQEIAKGSTLSEKLVTIGGGQSVRTIGKVLWSPLYGVNQTTFVQEVLYLTAMARADSKYTLGEHFEIRSQGLEKQGHASFKEIVRVRSDILHAVSTYLDVIPDRMDQDSWRSAFGQISKN
jgi:hypothetical protein